MGCECSTSHIYKHFNANVLFPPECPAWSSQDIPHLEGEGALRGLQYSMLDPSGLIGRRWRSPLLQFFFSVIGRRVSRTELCRGELRPAQLIWRSSL